MPVSNRITLMMWQKLWSDGASGKGSNLRPDAYKATALPTELRRHQFRALSSWFETWATYNRGFPFGQMNMNTVNKTELFMSCFTCDIKDLRCAAVA